MRYDNPNSICKHVNIILIILPLSSEVTSPIAAALVEGSNAFLVWRSFKPSETASASGILVESSSQDDLNTSTKEAKRRERQGPEKRSRDYLRR